MIAIVDYGMGNLRSVEKALARTGAAVRVTSDARQILDADGVVLPGVGAFGACMENLASRELVEPVRAAVRSGKPFLGICLGLQLLFEESEEFGPIRGLGILPGTRGALRRARARRPEDPADGLEPVGVRRSVPELARHRGRRVRLLRALVLRRARRSPTSIAASTRLRRRSSRRRSRGQRLRLPVPPGEEPGGGPAPARELRRARERVVIVIPAIDLRGGPLRAALPRRLRRARPCTATTPWRWPSAGRRKAANGFTSSISTARCPERQCTSTR